MYEGLIAETEGLRGPANLALPTYVARPLGPGPFPSIVMLHHRGGWDGGSKEIARRFAAEGIVCAMPHLHYHHAQSPDEAPEVTAATVLEAGGLPDDECLEITQAAYDHVSRQGFVTGRVGVLGFCSGGTQAFVAACELPFAGTVVCYGPRITESRHTPSESRPVAPITKAANLRGPVLGIFGEKDAIAPPEEAYELDAELERIAREHRISVYEGAGHAFLAAERDEYNVQAAREAWPEIVTWIHEQLG